MFLASSAWNTTVSSMRFRNSGRKWFFSSSHTASLISSSGRPTIAWMMGEPMLLVITITVFLKFTVRPWPSVRRPSSSTCSSTLNTSVVRLLDLVEQQHAVGLAAHGFGQVAALLVAHVAGRRADQARDRMLLHELAHVDADQVVFAVEQEARQRLAQLGLAHARGAEEQEGAGRAVRVGQARARAADRVGDRADGLVLADHALVQLVFHHAAACRARPASAWRPGCRWRAPPPRRSPRRRPACAAAWARCDLPLLASVSCASFRRFSSAGSLPYCSSATLLKSPLLRELLDLRT